MKINWKVRFQSPVFVVSFLTTLLTFVYNILGLFGIVTPITEQDLTNVIIAVAQILVALGILNDPTSKGLRDCKSVLGQTKPKDAERD